MKLTSAGWAPRPLLIGGLALAVLLALPGTGAAAEKKLIAADGAPQDAFGREVAIEGDTAVVGAPQDDGGRGAVYVFTRSGDGWAQTAKLRASDGVGNDIFGSSVAIDGDTIVVGAPGVEAGSIPNTGAVYTFASTGAENRTETAELSASDGAAADALGFSVAIDGDTIAAGAYLDDVDGEDQGSAYTFARSGADRNEIAKLTSSDGAAGDYFGFPVAIDGDTIVAGANRDDIGGNPGQGSAYTFARSGADRTQTAKLTASDGIAYAQFGFSVAIAEDTVVAGAPGDGVGVNSQRGALYTFTRSGADRSETAKLTASDSASNDFLGVSAAVDSDTIVSGARGDDIGDNGAQGSAYTFARSGADRNETARLTASDGAAFDHLGDSVAVEGDTIIAGVVDDDIGSNSDQGSASIFFPGTAGTGLSPAGPSDGSAGGPNGGSASADVINGSAGDDVIRGTPGNDVINCGAGDDVVTGGGGNDVIRCGPGSDRVDGGSGNDRIEGQSGPDRLAGGAGRDRVYGGTGNDRAGGGRGNDLVSGGDGNDRLSGAGGNDRVSGGAGRDRVAAGRGNDVTSGGPGSDRLAGDSGRDRLSGGGGRDHCAGGRGRDRASSCERRSAIP